MFPLLALFYWYANARYILNTTSVSHSYRAALMNEMEPRYLTAAEVRVYVGDFNFLQLPQVLTCPLNVSRHIFMFIS
jgi:hypothetical protein